METARKPSSDGMVFEFVVDMDLLPDRLRVVTNIRWCGGSAQPIKIRKATLIDEGIEIESCHRKRQFRYVAVPIKGQVHVFTMMYASDLHQQSRTACLWGERASADETGN